MGRGSQGRRGTGRGSRGHQGLRLLLLLLPLQLLQLLYRLNTTSDSLRHPLEPPLLLRTKAANFGVSRFRQRLSLFKVRLDLIVLRNNLLKLLRGNTLGITERLIAANALVTERGIGRRDLASKATLLAKRARGPHNDTGTKDSCEKSVALNGFNFGFRGRFLHTA